MLNRELGEVEAGYTSTETLETSSETFTARFGFIAGSLRSTARTNRYDKYITNEVGQLSNITYKNVATSKRWKSDLMRRKFLSHMLQGLESWAVYGYAVSHKAICALDHDGFVHMKR
ncbi:hypothetical protein [Pantoea agglomerans]|uniref:hypothetical protein n=1 Tax=Enterobacter agglomerans TaxID=549 RepID=UPI001CD036D1|nr:hypothetical protein [Pantoea agglomerans]UBN52923.1 hypothetical protein LB453_13625 [Pantoea agglomerans]